MDFLIRELADSLGLVVSRDSIGRYAITDGTTVVCRDHDPRVIRAYLWGVAWAYANHV